MSARERIVQRLAPAALLLTLACGGKEPVLAPVSGRVFYKGQPLPAGSIVFTPNADKGGRGPLARGEIQTDGSYSLRTNGAPGSCAGWHRVTVVSVQAAAEQPAAGKFLEVRSLLPARYASPDLSGDRKSVV